MLKEILKKDEIAAMKARDKAKVSILRLVNADVKAFEVNERQDIPDSEAIKIIEKTSLLRRFSPTRTRRG